MWETILGIIVCIIVFGSIAIATIFKGTTIGIVCSWIFGIWIGVLLLLGVINAFRSCFRGEIGHDDGDDDGGE